MKLITTDHDRGPQILQCPVCGEDYTHISSVSVFARGEDESKGLHVSVSGIDTYNCTATPSVIVDNNMSGNTSGRRGSVSFTFHCEICQNQSTVAFSQHKGNTHIAVVDCHAVAIDGA